ncbi:PE domain-containing protein [Mycobacterium leprae]|uniref:PE domain-containing protein n=1 Tax=Mycobacterium leprae TaxID=1769 RepID=UPI0002E4E343
MFPDLNGVTAAAIDALLQKAGAYLRIYAEQYQQTLARCMAILNQFSEVLAINSTAY